MICAVLSLLAWASVRATNEGSSIICTNTCETKGNGVCDDGGTGSKFGTCDIGTDCEDCGERFGEEGNCMDDAAWTDAEHGPGHHTCKDFAHQRFWCTDFGTYSEAAKRACPVSCGLCTRTLSNPGCKCAGVDNHMGVGAKCDPERLYNGLQWCYVDRETCPNALISELKSVNEKNLGFVYCGDVDISDEECNEECVFSEDGRCDDGGMGSVSSVCPLGSDCTDCGPRIKNPNGVEVSIDVTYYPTLRECIDQENALGAEVQTSNFPKTPEDEPVCVATGDVSSDLVSCDAFGVVTSKPFKGGNACGANGGKEQGEKKWAFWLQGNCFEATFNDQDVFARVDWEGPCQSEEPPKQGCYAEEGKMKFKIGKKVEYVESEEFSSVDDCACSQLCKGIEENGERKFSHFQWTEKNEVCQCFKGKLKKYKAKSGVFSGPL